MIYYGLIAMARSMAIQYGDGLANVEFWKESLYWYNLFGKVVMMHLSSYITRVACGVSNINDHSLTKWPIIDQFLFFLLFLSLP